MFDRYLLGVGAGRALNGEAKIAAPKLIRRQSERWFNDWHERYILQAGLEMSPFMRADLVHQIALEPSLGDAMKAGELARALSTNYAEQLGHQIEYRLNNAANLFLHLTGETGSGKSSCSLWLGAESGLYDCHIETAEDLDARLCYELWEVPKKLANIGKRDVVFMDESPRGAGHGSKTDQSNFLNLQDQIRAGQKNLHVCSPELEARSTTQATLEAIATTPIRHFNETGFGGTMFLVRRGDRYLGHALLPWCSPELYKHYQIVKKRHVGKAENLQKEGPARYAEYLEIAVKESPRLLMLAGGTKTEFMDAFEICMSRYNLDSDTITRVGRLAYTTHRTAGGDPAALDIIQETYGIKFGPRTQEAFLAA